MKAKRPSPFVPPIVPMSGKAREKQRRKRRASAQQRYRARLQERGAAEIRDLAMLVLAAYCETVDHSAGSHRITEALRRRIVEAGLSEKEASTKLRLLRLRVLSNIRSPAVAKKA